jgi:hypothetical protein
MWYGFCLGSEAPGRLSVRQMEEKVMKTLNTVAVAAFSMLLIASLGSILAADEMSILAYNGDLVRVSTDSHTVVVRGSDEKDWEFTYTDKTEVTGAMETIEGLAGKTGTPVTIRYKKEGNRNIATNIEVHEKQAY